MIMYNIKIVYEFVNMESFHCKLFTTGYLSMIIPVTSTTTITATTTYSYYHYCYFYYIVIIIIVIYSRHVIFTLRCIFSTV